MEASDYQEAEAFLSEALSIFRSQHLTLGIAKSLSATGELARLQAASERAAIAYEEAVTLFSQLGNSAGMSVNLANLGWVSQRLGDDRRAEQLFRESLSLAQQIHDRGATVNAIAGLAALAVKAHELDRAVQLFGAIEAQRFAYGNALCAADRADYEPFIVTARSQMEQATFDRRWQEGSGLTLEQAIARAQDRALRRSTL